MSTHEVSECGTVPLCSACSRCPALELTFAAYWRNGTDRRMRRSSSLWCLSLLICVVSLTITWLMNGICWTTEKSNILFQQPWSWLLPHCKALKVKMPSTISTGFQSHLEYLWPVLQITVLKLSVKYLRPNSTQAVIDFLALFYYPYKMTLIYKI